MYCTLLIYLTESSSHLIIIIIIIMLGAWCRSSIPMLKGKNQKKKMRRRMRKTERKLNVIQCFDCVSFKCNKRAEHCERHHRKIIVQTKMCVHNTLAHAHICIVSFGSFAHSFVGKNVYTYWSGYRFHNDIFQVIDFIYEFFLALLKMYWQPLSSIGARSVVGVLFWKSKIMLPHFFSVGRGCHC